MVPASVRVSPLPTLILIVLAYALCCWWDSREERRRAWRVERELADLERQERERSEPWL
jgi:hypothetical protein